MRGPQAIPFGPSAPGGVLNFRTRQRSTNPSSRRRSREVWAVTDARCDCRASRESLCMVAGQRLAKAGRAIAPCAAPG